METQGIGDQFTTAEKISVIRERIMIVEKSMYSFVIDKAGATPVGHAGMIKNANDNLDALVKVKQEFLNMIDVLEKEE